MPRRCSGSGTALMSRISGRSGAELRELFEAGRIVVVVRAQTFSSHGGFAPC